MKKYTLFFFLLSFSNGFSQNFTNSDLNGVVGSSNVPAFWNFIPYTSPICNANFAGGDSPDVHDTIEQTPGWGDAGYPYSGLTYVRGLYANNIPSWFNPSPYSSNHEGIEQMVCGFTIGDQYTIHFQQAIAKTPNHIDSIGAWSIYLDNSIFIGNSAMSTSSVGPLDLNIIWESRSISFIATSNNHLIQFIPYDNDSNQLITVLSSSNGSVMQFGDALSMAIDSIYMTGSNSSPTPSILGGDTTFCTGSILLDATSTGSSIGSSYLWQDNSTNSTLLISTPGVYYVVVSKNGCVSIDTINVSIKCNFTAFLLDTSICQGACIDLIVTSSDNTDSLSFIWDNGILNNNDTVNVCPNNTIT